jgi:opacity protein-like surface antigen
MKKLFLIIVSLALPPASALAADLQLPFKSPAETFSWTGFYVGGNAGGRLGK